MNMKESNPFHIFKTPPITQIGQGTILSIFNRPLILDIFFLEIKNRLFYLKILVN